MDNLYSRIDQLASYDHPRHQLFRQATEEVVRVRISTRASTNGKVAGFWLSDEKFIQLDQMGDGIVEMMALITELCLERRKVFVLEEPETHLHPRALRGLMSLVRQSVEYNQFFVATHSNVVIRELATCEGAKVFRVYRDPVDRTLSHVEEVENSPSAHMELLRELGYDFGDLGLYDAWLFLEESSAEAIINRVLIPIFVPGLAGRLRTFSSAGVTNLEPRLEDFQKLMTFIHLEPAYRDRLWVKADGDDLGKAVAEKLRGRFAHLNADTCSTFAEGQFERYYPARFTGQVNAALATEGKNAEREAKRQLLMDVIEWTTASKEQAEAEWAESAKEVIEFLAGVETKLLAKDGEQHE